MENLAIVFAEELTFAFVPAADIASFVIQNVRYQDIGAGHLVAFYDRLLGKNSELIGFQLWDITEESDLDALIRALPSRRYLLPWGGSPPIYQLFLGEVSNDAVGNGEQAFGGQIFRGSGGEVALTIDLEYLFDGEQQLADLATLQCAPVQWAAIEQLELHPRA